MAGLDMSEVEALARNLGRTATNSRAMLNTLGRGAGKGMKAQMQKEAAGVSSAPRLPSAINYDFEATPLGFKVEVGPQKDPATPGYKGSGRGGSLALLYFGNRNLTNPPIADPIHTLRDEARKTERAIVVAVTEFFQL